MTLGRVDLNQETVGEGEKITGANVTIGEKREVEVQKEIVAKLEIERGNATYIEGRGLKRITPGSSVENMGWTTNTVLCIEIYIDERRRIVDSVRRSRHWGILT